MPTLDLLYFDVTSGHRSAALALQRALERPPHSADVRVVNLVDLLAEQRALQALARAGIDFFNWGMREERSLLPSAQIKAFQGIQRALPPAAHEAVAGFWRDRTPDAVASVIPICNAFLQRALHHRHPACPYVVVPVDFTEGLRRYWFDTDADAHYLNPTARLMAQSRDAGVSAARAIAVPGMPIDPAFYETPTTDRAGGLRALGLAPEHPTVLVSFGGQGSVSVEACARRLNAFGASLNVIFLCGRNETGRRRVAQLSTPYRKVALGFTPEAPARYYALADVVVGKPGSMTITEALVMRKPIVAVASNTLAVVQRGNEAWIRDAGVGVVCDLADVAGALRGVLRRGDVAAAIERVWHRGVFEIAARIAEIADRRGIRRERDACLD